MDNYSRQDEDNAMTNPAKPTEHFTLEQVERLIPAKCFSSNGYLYIKTTEVQALLNDAFNKRIVEPVYFVKLDGQYFEISEIYFNEVDRPDKHALYTLKDIKP